MRKNHFFSKILRGNGLTFWTGTFLVSTEPIYTILMATISKYIIDTVIPSCSKKLLLVSLGILLGLRAIWAVTTYFSNYFLSLTGQRLAFKLREKGFEKILTLNFKYFDTHRTGDIMTRMTSDIEFVQTFFAHVFPGAIARIIMFAASVIVMFAVGGPLVSVVMLITIPSLAFMAYRLSKEIHPTFRRIRELRARLNTVVQENISANRVVKAFCRENFENMKLEKANAEFKKANLSSNKVSLKYTPYILKIQNIFFLYIILVGGILVIKGQMTIGELVMFNSIVWMVTGPLSTVGYFVNEFSNIFASSEKIGEFLNEIPDIANDPTVKLKRLKGNIEFENVSFDYDGEGALSNVNFKISQGQRIGIVGTTGSGKSTIINLLCRFYEPAAGRVLIDGEDIRKIDLELLRKSISVSQQDVFLFSESIGKNIAYGHTGAKQEDIVRAAKIAKAHDFISALPEGYDTIVGERGLGLSGGQKQRITLARAILKNPSILVLDDTTSALDADTEKYVQQQIEKKLRGMTVIVISQRISSVKDSDRIFVLDEGMIIEQGTHQELISQGGYYYNIYKEQHKSRKKGQEVQ